MGSRRAYGAVTGLGCVLIAVALGAALLTARGIGFDTWPQAPAPREAEAVRAPPSHPGQLLRAGRLTAEDAPRTGRRTVPPAARAPLPGARRPAPARPISVRVPAPRGARPHDPARRQPPKRGGRPRPAPGRESPPKPAGERPVEPAAQETPPAPGKKARKKGSEKGPEAAEKPHPQDGHRPNGNRRHHSGGIKERGSAADIGR